MPHCAVAGCVRLAAGKSACCKAHGGGRRCQIEGCNTAAVGSGSKCTAHGGGKRCAAPNCTTSARGKSSFCIKHGGGRRCSMEGCKKSAQGSTQFCKAHGGGRRCALSSCTRVVSGTAEYCVKHKGGSYCKAPNCVRQTVPGYKLCVIHGGGATCSWPDCNKPRQCPLFCSDHSGHAASLDEFSLAEMAEQEQHRLASLGAASGTSVSVFSRAASASSVPSAQREPTSGAKRQYESIDSSYDTSSNNSIGVDFAISNYTRFLGADGSGFANSAANTSSSIGHSGHSARADHRSSYEEDGPQYERVQKRSRTEEQAAAASAAALASAINMEQTIVSYAVPVNQSIRDAIQPQGQSSVTIDEQQTRSAPPPPPPPPGRRVAMPMDLQALLS